MTCDSVASPVALPQLGPRQPDLANAAMHSVLRVAAAEDPSRHCCSLLVSHLSGKGAQTNKRQADSFGSASFGHVYAQPELTPLQPGKLKGSEVLASVWTSP